MRTVPLKGQVHKIRTTEGLNSKSDAPMLTPALRSSASFSGVLTFGPEAPHGAEDEARKKRERFRSTAISNGDDQQSEESHQWWR